MRYVRLLVCSGLLFVGLSTLRPVRGADAKPQPDLGHPLPAAEAASHMTLPEGFHVSLFAGEPDVAQPIAFTTDDRGRLWVAECFSYPNWAATGKDQLLLFNDKTDTGHFSDRQVVLGDLNNFTGFELGFGGVWTCQAPLLKFIPLSQAADSPKPSGDPKPILEGWSTGGRHNIVNCLTWGPDGWLYGLNGVSSFSMVGLAGGAAADRQGISCGVWRYHPTKKRFEVVACGTTNPFGLDYDDYGEMFITNCVLAHLWHITPGAHYKRMHGIDEMPYSFELLDATSDHLHWGGGDWTTSRGGQGIHSEAGGGHAHAGAMIYLGDNWPDSYRNSIFMCNIHGNRVNNDRLERSGSDYVGHHAKDFLFAGDVWFRGLNMKYGPDGGVLLSDWCDNGECHNYAQTDRVTGRMYKIVYGQPKPTPADLDLSKLSDAELVALQLHKNDWYVRHARRLLQERAADGKDMSAVHKALHTMFDDQTAIPKKLRALWALHVTSGDSPEFLLSLLKAPDEHLRVWGTRLLVEDKNPGPAALAEFERLAKDDPSPFVRLNLASALQRIPPAERWALAKALVQHGDDAADKNLPLMIWYGLEGAIAVDPARGLELAAECQIPLVRRFIARRVTIGQPGGSPKQQTSLVAQTVLKAGDNPAVQLDLLRGMHDALRGRRNEPKPDGWDQLYAKLGDHPLAALQAEAHGLAVIFGDTHALDSLKAVISDSKAELRRRTQAIDVLVEAHADIAGALQKLLDEPAVRGKALQGLAAYDDRRTPELILSRYASLTADEKRDAVGALVARPAYALALLAAIEAGKIPAADLSIAGARQIKQFDNKQLSDRLTKTWGALRDSPTEKKAEIDHYKQILTPAAIKSADASAGRVVFSGMCAKCHTLYGEGAKIGPDLTGANRANVDYVLQKVVDPSAAVPNDFRLKMAFLKDGRLVAGIVKEQSPKSVVLQTETQLVTLSTDDIEELKPSGQSLMPERQLDKLSPAEIRNLFAYLATTQQAPLPAGSVKSSDPPKTNDPPKSSSRLKLHWEDEWLTISGERLPGGKVRVHYLEAFCRPGSTDRDWQQTVIKHRTELVAEATDGNAIDLKSTLADGVIVTHKLTVERPEDATDVIDFQLLAKNPTDKPSEADWAQPCVRVDAFTGLGQDDYVPKCFVFVGGKLTRLPTKPWADKARYTPGQVYAAPGVDRNDVNPRPLSSLTPSCGLVGCYSGDEKLLLATAWQPYQELFQGVGVCVHSDFRIGGLKPGESKPIRGKMYITSAGAEALVSRYEHDFPEQVKNAARGDGKN